MKWHVERFAVAMLAALLLWISSPVQAAYPEKAVTMIIPFPAGGRTDLVGRIVAQGLEKHLKVAVAVVNKAGAGGVVGAKEVANARPDGYTLGTFSSAVVSAQYTVETPTNLADYELVGLIEISPAALAVQYTAPWKNLREFVAHAKANPDKIRLGTIPGASAQVFAGGLADAAGIKLTFVPFNGDAPGAISLAGGHIESHVAVPVSYNTLIAAKKIKMLGVAADRRLSLYPDVPTFQEQGVNLVIGSFHAVFAPKGTPDGALKTLEAALQKALADPQTKDQMTKAGLAVEYRDREGTKKFVAGQDQSYRRLIEQLGMMYKKK